MIWYLIFPFFVIQLLDSTQELQKLFQRQGFNYMIINIVPPHFF